MQALSVPVLETARLRLRAPSPDDFSDCLAMWTDPDVTRFIGGRASTPEEVWSRLLTYRGHWATFGFGFWIVESREDGRHMGEVGFADFHRTVEPPVGDVPEMGWAFRTATKGEGVASEAVAVALAWRDRSLPGAATRCIINEQNIASRRVAEKNGFAELCVASYRDAPILMFER